MKHLSKQRLPRWIGKRSILGATVTELILSLFIGAVMIGYAVPNFQTFIINNRTISGTNMVVSALNFARSEAIKRGIPVTACASSDYASCTTSGWHVGWMVFTDEPIAGVADGSDEVLRTQQGVELDITLISGQTFIRFAPNGALADAGLDDEFEGLVTRPNQPSTLRNLVANLLPINSAHADSSSDDDSGGGGSGGSGGQSGGSGGGSTGGSTQQGGSNPVTYTFEVCPKTSGYKGRAISVLASGQLRVSEIACSSS
ncbi:MAG: GspH/FimT family pseudopilin [Arenicellales bacterium]|nr:GspH/FimT family pseudopilin [Arenicellales bacterium]